MLTAVLFIAAQTFAIPQDVGTTKSSGRPYTKSTITFSRVSKLRQAEDGWTTLGSFQSLNVLPKWARGGRPGIYTTTVGMRIERMPSFRAILLGNYRGSRGSWLIQARYRGDDRADIVFTANHVAFGDRISYGTSRTKYLGTVGVGEPFRLIVSAISIRDVGDVTAKLVTHTGIATQIIRSYTGTPVFSISPEGMNGGQLSVHKQWVFKQRGIRESDLREGI